MNMDTAKAYNFMKNLSGFDRLLLGSGVLVLIAVAFVIVLLVQSFITYVFGPYEHSFRAGMVVSHVVSDTRGIVIDCDRHVCIVSTGLAVYVWNVIEIKTLPQT